MKTNENKFDKSVLSAFEHELLEEFYKRRRMYEEDLDKSSIIHHKHSCPGCGFPTLNNKSDFETCIICLWEDCGLDDKSDTLIGPPNYQSLVEHRINISNMLRNFTRQNSWEITSVQLIQKIMSFEKEIKLGKVKIDSDNYENNLKMIVFRE